MTQQSPVDNVLSKLRNVKKAGSNWHASCPCRADDDNPSLSVKEGDDGRVLFSCHYGSPCNVNQICESLNIKVKDLYPADKQVSVSTTQKKNKLVKAYPYRDEDGVLLFEKLRFVTEDGKKTFRQRRPDPSNPTKYLYDLDGVRKVLYNLPAVVKAVAAGEPIWIVEGEKDADSLIRLGITATTTTLGAGVWEAEHTRPLIGAYVEIVADNDKPGIEHALDVATKLRSAGCTVNTWVSKEFKDISDHLGAGKELDELCEMDEQGSVVVPDLASDFVKTVREKMLDVFSNTELDDSQVFSRLALILGKSTTPTKEVRDGRLVKWSEFIKEKTDDTYQWVIPGVIEKQERVIVVAAEGVGKTMLARQVAICCAAGIHPFTYQRMPRVRTLTVDLENPERIIKRTSSKIMSAAIARGFETDIDAHLLIKPDGLDLCSSEDRALLEAHIERIRPELICLGPLYKSYIDSGTRTSEALAIEVARYLDQIRDVYGCALWLEHHAPLGSMGSRDLRPFGSSVWSRWPEFGIALQPDPTALEGFTYEVRHFRGARDVREWPTKMKRGTLFPFEVLEFMKVD
jgi:5S rRNA maturation endonuclease (ribonuclease M5)